MRARATGLIVVMALGLGACGEQRSEDEKRVRAALSEALTTKDPDACSRLATAAFLEHVTGERGKAALRSCREDAGETDAESVAIDRVTISGATADADVRPKGGELTFKTLRIGLRKAGGDWRLDRLKGGTLDRPAFFRETRAELTSPPDELSDATADCVLRDLKATGDDVIVRAVIGPDRRPLLLPVVVCGIRNEIAERDAPERVISCVAGRLRQELTGGATGRRLEADRGSLTVLDSPRFERTVARITARCLARLSPSGPTPSAGRVS